MEDPELDPRPGPFPGAWYERGLAFTCSGCGHCCTGDPGIVRASDGEVTRMAEHVEMEEAVFRDQYTHRLSSGGVALRERSENACVFWRKGAGCVIYPVRPRQCRTWPFWRSNVATEAHWRNAAATCPGIGEGTAVDARTIRETSESDGTSGVIPELKAP